MGFVGAVLVVDSDTDSRRSIATTLSRAGHDVVHVDGGEAALVALDRQRFDVVVTELRLPDMDGLVLLDTIKAAAPEIGVLFVAQKASVTETVKVMRRGAITMLEKPIAQDELLSEVTAAVRTMTESRPPGPRDGVKETIARGKSTVDRHIGRFIVRGRIGTGGMGSVFDGVDPEIGRPVALKTLDPQDSLVAEVDQKDLARFRREAHVIGNLVHPNIVALYEFGFDEKLGRFYLAMERVHGESVRRLIDRFKRISVERALAITYQVVDALELAHRSDVVHRDIKPTNIIVTAAGVAKVVDFGIAQLPRSEITDPGQLVGTVSYLAPEMLLGKSTDSRADQYAVGAVLYEMLTGQQLFPSAEFEQMAKAILDGATVDFKAHGVRVPRRLSKVLSRMVSRDPADRFDDEMALLTELASVGKKLSLVLQPAVPR